MAARDDAIGEIAAAMEAPPLQCEISTAVEPEHHLHALGRDRDHVAGLEVADLRDGEPAAQTFSPFATSATPCTFWRCVR